MRECRFVQSTWRGRQHQANTQRLLDGIEVKLGAGARCAPESLEDHSFSVEVNVINNLAIDEIRLGGDRLGWQLLGEWQWFVLGGVFATRIELALCSMMGIELSRAPAAYDRGPCLSSTLGPTI